MPVFRDVHFERPELQIRSGVFASTTQLDAVFGGTGGTSALPLATLAAGGVPSGGTEPALDCSTLPAPAPSFCCNACRGAGRPGMGVFLAYDEQCRPTCTCDLPCPEDQRPPDTVLGLP